MSNLNEQKIKISKNKTGVKFCVRVIPNSSKCEISGIIDESIKIKLDVPPIEGKANDKCIKFLSKLLDLPKSSIKIVLGEKSKSKIIEIKGNPDELYLKIVNFVELSLLKQ